MIVTLGIEYFRNDTGMEFDGANVCSFSVDNIDLAKEQASTIIKDLQSNSDKLYANVKLMKESGSVPVFKLNNGERALNDKADVFAMQVCGSTHGFDKIAAIVRGDSYWFHLFIKKEMASRQTGMFDADPSSELNAEPKSFDEVMSDSAQAPVQNIEFTEAYFNRAGDEIPGVPDFWQVQAGLH